MDQQTRPPRHAGMDRKIEKNRRKPWLIGAAAIVAAGLLGWLWLGHDASTSFTLDGVNDKHPIREEPSEG